MNFSAAALWSWSSAEMVTTCKPWARSLSSRSANWGSSARQGAHQVAQKSYKTTLPLWASTSFWKPASLMGTSGTSGAEATSGRQNKKASVRFIVIILRRTANAFDSAAEGFGLGG